MRCAICALLLALATSAAADTLADARAAFSSVRYDEALRLLDRAWRDGGHNPSEIREIFELAGQAAASVGDDDAARQWLSRWLSLDPHGELPAGTSPKITKLLGDARRGLAGASITADARQDGARVRFAITSDPLGLVDGVRLGDARAGIAEHSLPDAPGDLELVDRFGNVLATIAVTRAVAAPPSLPAVRDTPPPPAYARWPTWAITAGGLALVGGGAMWVAVDARSSLRTLDAASASHEYSEAHALEDRLDRAQWVARISFGGAAIAAIASAILWTRGPAVAPTRDGGVVAWQW